ncbi:MAG: radical SAM protein [Candidatus Krumholzibacteria bacterium]|nr:radical SAM protein [Candidatus Krumholzibacteria bacterium]
MKVLLVSPPAGISYASLGINRPPLGLAYIASIIRDEHEVQIADFNVDRKSWKKFPFGAFDVVGISVDTSRYHSALKIAALAKAAGATVVMGGPHVSFMDEEALTSGPVDYVVRNEGEYSFLSLMDFLSGKRPFEAVRGVSRLEGGACTRTPDAPFIQDLDSLPFPARDLLSLDRYREKMNGRPTTTLATSRGCPYNCHFCSSSQFFGVRWRARSAENVIEEIATLHDEHHFRALSFVEDNFTFSPERAVAISEKIIAKGWNLIWGAWSRVDTIVKHPDMVQTMARAGFKWTFVGFESGSQKVLDEYGKKAMTQDALRAMKILKENGVGVTGSFILGAPAETKSMMKDTVRFAKKLNPHRVQFTILTPFPGTKLYETVRSRLLTDDWRRYTGLHPTIRLDHVSSKEMKKQLAGAYIAFYARMKQGAANMPYFLKILPASFNVLAYRMAAVCRIAFVSVFIDLFKKSFRA